MSTHHGLPTSRVPPRPPVHVDRVPAVSDWRRAMDHCVSGHLFRFFPPVLVELFVGCSCGCVSERASVR